MLLQDKVVIVTGVGPGLGRELCLAAASHGASVVCMARTASFVEEVAAGIRADGGAAIGVAGDVTSRDDCERVVAATEREFGRLDGVVNSAFSAGAIGLVSELDLDHLRTALEVNVFGALNLLQCAVPLLEQDGGGAVVNINTLSAVKPRRGEGFYGISKAGLEFVTRQLAVDLGPRGIRCVTAYCGPMRGPNLDDAMTKWAERRNTTFDAIVEATTAVIASGRIPTDREAARAIVLLLSDDAHVYTGTSIHATGGAWLEHRI